MSWQRYVSSVSVPLPFPVRVGTEVVDGRERVFVELTVRCHESDETITVKTGRPVQPVEMMTDDEAARVIRGLVRIALCHEIDEAITVDGKRPFRPHAITAMRAGLEK